MNYEECAKLAEAGTPCQMLNTDGKWVKFDPLKVITKFRPAPQLKPTDGAKVLVYALHELERRVEKFFHDSGRWVDLPESGHKADPFLTYGHKGYLGHRKCRAATHNWEGRTIECEERVDKSWTRLRDIFRSYFRVAKRTVAKDETEFKVHGTTEYSVAMRNLMGEERWIELFRVFYAKCIPGSQYEFIENDNDDFEEHWVVIDVCRFFHLPEDGPESSEPAYKAKTYLPARYGKRTPVVRQVIQTVSKVNRAGGDIFHNLARYIISYLTILSDMDMNMENFSSFISRNMKDSDNPTYRITTPSWKTNGKSRVEFKHYSELKEYRDAVLGKRKYDKDGCADHEQVYAILLRYFDTKYHGTIDEVTQ